jgi:hypothetical protein
MTAKGNRAYLARLKADPVKYRAFRDRVNANSRRLRAIPGWRAQHEPYHRTTVAEAPIPPLHVGHPLFERAKAAVPLPRALGTYLVLPGEDAAQDARSEYVLAALEKRDPVEAVAAFNRQSREWRNRMVDIDAYI